MEEVDKLIKTLLSKGWNITLNRNYLGIYNYTKYIRIKDGPISFYFYIHIDTNYEDIKIKFFLDDLFFVEKNIKDFTEEKALEFINSSNNEACDLLLKSSEILRLKLMEN